MPAKEREEKLVEALAKGNAAKRARHDYKEVQPAKEDTWAQISESSQLWITVHNGFESVCQRFAYQDFGCQSLKRRGAIYLESAIYAERALKAPWSCNVYYFVSVTHQSLCSSVLTGWGDSCVSGQI